MRTSEFQFDLPPYLIAQHPSPGRGESRLLVMDRKVRSLEHRMVRELPSIIEKGTLMVFNNSRVRKARLYGVARTGGAKAEFLLLDKIDGEEGMAPGRLWRAMVRRAGRRHKGSYYLFGNPGAGNDRGPGNSGEDLLVAEIVQEDGECRVLKFDRPVDDAWLDLHGHVPLPPYIRRLDSAEDGDRYQTVYAREYGSAAAPTAGLHFTEELLKELEIAGIETAFITLHVGLGTFLPVRTEKLEDHNMHRESFSIGEEAAVKIERAKAEGRKVLAVGTTSVRTLESVWKDEPASCRIKGRVDRGEGSTSIFIYPGYTFKAVDALFTNFHTPGSTLLMLVSAFAGKDFVLESYREAVKEAYRFFSYGDACLIL